MLYRENGQFKTSYKADQQIFPIAQDKVLVLAMIALALAADWLGRAVMLWLASGTRTSAVGTSRACSAA